MIQVLQAARGPAQLDAMRRLLARNNGLATAAVGRCLTRLDAPAQAALLDDPALLEPVARSALHDDDEAIRLASIAMIVQARRPSTAYLLVGALGDRSEAVRRGAGEALLGLLRAFGEDPAVMEAHLVPALTAGLRNLAAHRCEAMLAAAVLLGRRCGRDVIDRIDSPANKLTGPLAALLREMPAPQCADFVIRTLPWQHAGSVARAYVASAPWPTLAALGAADHWRLLAPVRAAMAEIRHVRCAADDPAGLADLSDAEQAAALRFVLACGIAPQVRRTLLGEALGAGPSAALVAAGAIVSEAGEEADGVLMALQSPHPDVQAVAAARLLACRTDAHVTEHLLKVLPALSAPVAAVVGQYLAVRSFNRYWSSYARLDHEIRQTAGRALLKLDAGVADLLAARLLGRDVNVQMQALQMIRQLRMAARYAPHLARLARQGDGRVRSASAAALGGAEGADVRRTLARCLDDGDMRVQANAVEAMARLGGDPSAVLDKLDSPNNRVRANTIKWLLEAAHPQGPMALAAMLADSRPAHRISALWVVQTLAYQPAVGLLRRLALSDGDTKVRSRMATVLRDLAPAGAVEVTRG
ncbi:MAG: hypothetical protein GX591_03465 [Planctomycetes bacterium]|nr:hypothetical protein [Planctomycetota bacterium]